MILIDTNVLVYAINIDAPQHGESRAFVDGWARPGGGVLFPQVLLEFYAIVTDSRRVARPLAAKEAWTQVEALRSIFPLLDKVVEAFAYLPETLAEAGARGGDVFDAFLAAQMRAGGIQGICTYNTKDFQCFKGIQAMGPGEVELQRGIPFSVRIPNETTLQALDEARTRKNLESFNTLDDLLTR